MAEEPGVTRGFVVTHGLDYRSVQRDVAALDGALFEALCVALLSARYGRSALQLRPPDHGTDALVFHEASRVAFQFKHSTANRMRKAECRKGIERSIVAFSPDAIQFVFSFNPTADQLKTFFNEIAPAASETRVEPPWGWNTVWELISAHPSQAAPFLHSARNDAILAALDAVRARPSADDAIDRALALRDAAFRVRVLGEDAESQALRRRHVVLALESEGWRRLLVARPRTPRAWTTDIAFADNEARNRVRDQLVKGCDATAQPDELDIDSSTWPAAFAALADEPGLIEQVVLPAVPEGLLRIVRDSREVLAQVPLFPVPPAPGEPESWGVAMTDHLTIRVLRHQDAFSWRFELSPRTPALRHPEHFELIGPEGDVMDLMSDHRVDLLLPDERRKRLIATTSQRD